MSIVFHSPVPKGPSIIVANHPTGTDPFVLTTVSNGQAAILIHSPAFQVPIFGGFLKLSGHIPVKDGEGKIAFEKALDLLKKGITVIIFIEGGFSKYINKVGKPKTGVVRLALASGVPIIPVGISVKKRNVKTIKAIINGAQKWGKWYLNGPYAMTIGSAIILKGNESNRIRVRKLSTWVANKISLLQKESTKRII